MKKYGKITAYFAFTAASIFGIWLIKKGFYDKGFDSEKQERIYLVDAVLVLRGMPVTLDNRNKLNKISTTDLMKELGITKDADGNYIDVVQNP